MKVLLIFNYILQNVSLTILKHTFDNRAELCLQMVLHVKCTETCGVAGSIDGTFRRLNVG